MDKTHKGITLAGLVEAIRYTIVEMNAKQIIPTGIILGGKWKHVLDKENWLLGLRAHLLPNESSEIYLIADLYAANVTQVDIEPKIIEDVYKILGGGGITALIESIFSWEVRCKLLFDDLKMKNTLERLSGYHREITICGYKHSLSCHDGEIRIEAKESYKNGDNIAYVLQKAYNMHIDASVISNECESMRTRIRHHKKVLTTLLRYPD